MTERYDGDDRDSSTAFRAYDSVSEPVSTRTPWQIWRDACAWQREATIKENACNRSLNKNNKSGYPGVSWHKASGKWVSQIMRNGKKKSLGLFADPASAHEAYVQARLINDGEFFNDGR